MNEKLRPAIEAAKQHARRKFPEESCGFIVKGEYVPVENIAADPETHKADDKNCDCRLCSFRISNADVSKHLQGASMLLHSHPNGPVHPSQTDMHSQIKMNMPWGVIALDEDRIGDPEMWGDQLDIEPLLGRQFMHGIRDCYSIIRDTYRMGRERLAMDGVTDEWPFDPIYLADCPRDDAWWETADDLYQVNFPKWGFVEISMEKVLPGDVFMGAIRSGDKMNHGGMMITKDMILHHLPQRYSRREPAGLWSRMATKWVRYMGEGSPYA